MRSTTREAERRERRLPKSFRLLRAAVAQADGCVQEMLASFDSPDLAATGDRIDRIEEERRTLAAELEDHLRGSLLGQYDPADMQSFSAQVGGLTHRSARALYFFSLLGPSAAPSYLRLLVRGLAEATREVGLLVDDLAQSRGREVGVRAQTVRQLHDAARVHFGNILAIAPAAEERQLVLWRAVGEAIYGATAQALVVADGGLRMATKHD